MAEEVERRRISCTSGREFSLLDWGGTGPVALLHHANAFCGALWHPVARVLRSHFRVIGFDARGHGDSEPGREKEDYAWNTLARDLSEVASHVRSSLGVTSIGLGVGHSIGGTLMIAAGARSPELFDRMVLLDPVVLVPPMVPGLSEQRAREILEGTSGVLRAARRAERWASLEEARAHLQDKSLFAAWRQDLFELYLREGLRSSASGGVELKCSAFTEAAVLAGVGVIDLAAEASQLKCPTLLLWAERGNLKREHAEIVSRAMPSGQLEACAWGHLAPMEEPERVAETVLRFALRRS